jgi:hypothetical protein
MTCPRFARNYKFQIPDYMLKSIRIWNLKYGIWNLSCPAAYLAAATDLANITAERFETA